MLPAVLLLISAGAIYLACEYFVNGVEWLGRKTGVADSAVGSVLAAFGTALPETVVTFVAVVFGRDAAQRSIGIGAALGGPLVLATVAYAVVGLSLMATRRDGVDRPLGIDGRRLRRDQFWFLLIFIVKVALGFVVFSFKPWLGVLFLLAYVAYLWTELRSPDDEGESEPLEPLKLQPRHSEPTLGAVLLQTVVALLITFAASHVFVTQLELLAPWLGIPPALAALLLSPIATELPETMNAIIWVRQGKLRLALANISGAMMIQATVPSALGLLFTPWRFDAVLGLAGVLTAASIFGLWLLLRRAALTPRRLAAFGGFYLLFAIGVVALWRGGML